ncbi:MAG: hypothetical protein AAF438_09240 [Pseudomonadota bacterium]
MNHSELRTLFASYSNAWLENDSDALYAHWDKEDDAPFYKAEEIAEYFHRYDEILKYWQHNESFHDRVQLDFSDIQWKELSDKVLVVFVKMNWHIKFAPNTKTLDGHGFAHAGKTMAGENHVLAMLRRKDSGLKFCGWSETPDAPITYMGRLYQWAANRSE